MGAVIVFVGLPGSGKSYLINNIKRTNKSKIFTYSTDEYIEHCAARDHKSYTEVFELYIREATEHMNDALKAAIANGYTVIWDQTNMRSDKRRWILSHFPDSYQKQCFTISPPCNDKEWGVLYSRLSARPGKIIPGYVIDSMLNSYSEPALEEGFSQIHIASIMGGMIKQIPEPAHE
jgi:tRNA uridine 5-carbamoylmethylation protein Kti12